MHYFSPRVSKAKGAAREIRRGKISTGRLESGTSTSLLLYSTLLIFAYMIKKRTPHTAMCCHHMLSIISIFAYTITTIQLLLALKTNEKKHTPSFDDNPFPFPSIHLPLFSSKKATKLLLLLSSCNWEER
jgi:hypothetical protein